MDTAGELGLPREQKSPKIKAMAKKNNTATGGDPSGKKRNIFQNLKDSFTIVRRSFPWIVWAILATLVVAEALTVWYMIAGKHWIMGAITIVMVLMVVPMAWISAFLSRAMLRQIEGMKGCVGALRQLLRRSWFAEEEPVAVNKDQDLVWRFVGPRGIFLVSEGPHTRASKLLNDEMKKTTRVVAQVPVHAVECGAEEGQVRLEHVMKTMYKAPRALNRNEIPAVQKRLLAIHRNQGLPIPKGIDPYRVRPNRRALYG